MKDVYVSLSSVKQVQTFVGALVPLTGDFELLADHLVLDARSLMGIFGLDLTKPVKLRIYQDTPENMQAVKPFLARTEDAIDE